MNTVSNPEYTSEAVCKRRSEVDPTEVFRIIKNLTTNVYDYLLNEEDARVCKDISEDACEEVPGNFFLIIFAQFFTKLGDALASSKVILPSLLVSLGAPTFWGGLLVPIRESGSLLPQLLIGGYVRQFGLRKWFFVLGCIVQGCCVALMAWVAWAFSGNPAAIGIVVLLIIFSLARGLCSVASKDVLGKTVPKTRRGRLNGLSGTGAGFITIIVACLLLLNINSTLTLYHLLGIAAIVWLIGACIFARIVEFPGATTGGGNALATAFENLSLLVDDTVFRKFVLARALMIGSGLSAPLLVVLVQTHSELILWQSLGGFLFISGLSSLSSAWVWGLMSDISSRRVMMIASVVCAILCFLASMLALKTSPDTDWLAMIVFFFLSVAHQGVRLGRKTYLVDIAQGNRRTDYVAVSNTLIGIILILIGFLGAIVAQLSLVLAFALFATMSMLAFRVALYLPEA